MKSLAIFGLAIAMAPALASAQTAAPDTALPRPSIAAMEQVHAQMQQIEQRSRLQMLAALTPAHRAAVANIIGALAVAPNPDRDAAARSIDALLSPGERTSVLSTATAAHAQSRSLMEAARAQFEATLSADQRAQMQARADARKADHPQDMARAARTPDAGRTLLHLGGGAEGMHGFGPGMGGPPPQ